jgi:hypothetical protein
VSLNSCNMDAHRLVGLSSPIEVYMHTPVCSLTVDCTYGYSGCSKSCVNVSECRAVPVK